MHLTNCKCVQCNAGASPSPRRMPQRTATKPQMTKRPKDDEVIRHGEPIDSNYAAISMAGRQLRGKKSEKAEKLGDKLSSLENTQTDLAWDNPSVRNLTEKQKNTKQASLTRNIGKLADEIGDYAKRADAQKKVKSKSPRNNEAAMGYRSPAKERQPARSGRGGGACKLF